MSCCLHDPCKSEKGFGFWFVIFVLCIAGLAVLS